MGLRLRELTCRQSYENTRRRAPQRAEFRIYGEKNRPGHGRTCDCADPDVGGRAARQGLESQRPSALTEHRPDAERRARNLRAGMRGVTANTCTLGDQRLPRLGALFANQLCEPAKPC